MQTPLPSRLPDNIKQSSMCSKTGMNHFLKSLLNLSQYCLWVCFFLNVLVSWLLGMWDLISPTRDGPHTPPHTGRRSLSSWNSREVPYKCDLKTWPPDSTHTLAVPQGAQLVMNMVLQLLTTESSALHVGGKKHKAVQDREQVKASWPASWHEIPKYCFLAGHKWAELTVFIFIL